LQSIDPIISIFYQKKYKLVLEPYMPLDNKKEQERAELHRVIWNIANDLRGSVDG